MCSLIPLSIMKKLFLLLLVLSGVSLATAAQSITLGNYFIYDGEKYDAVTTLAGKTEDEVKAYFTNIKAQYTFTVNTNKTLGLDPGSMLANDAILSAETKLTITELAFLARTDDKCKSEDSTASIEINGTIYTSHPATYIDYGTDVYDVVRYTFPEDGRPTFTRNDTLSFKLSVSGSSTVNYLGIGGFNGSDIVAPTIGSAYKVFFQITALIPSLIPEPGSTTLSVLTLAFLTLRRRRG